MLPSQALFFIIHNTCSRHFTQHITLPKGVSIQRRQYHWPGISIISDYISHRVYNLLQLLHLVKKTQPCSFRSCCLRSCRLTDEKREISYCLYKRFPRHQKEANGLARLPCSFPPLLPRNMKMGVPWVSSQEKYTSDGMFLYMNPNDNASGQGILHSPRISFWGCASRSR